MIKKETFSESGLFSIQNWTEDWCFLNSSSVHAFELYKKKDKELQFEFEFKEVH